MRRMLSIPLAVLIALAAAAPASAPDWDVEAKDFEFTPRDRKIAVGDTVVWRFAATGHTTTAVRGQAERWNSGPEATPRGETFRHTFRRPGRFQYFCIPHEGFMKGVIRVGEDEVSDTLDAFTSRRSGSGVRVSFRLNEPATATYRLRGPEPRTVRRGRLAAGRHSFTVRNLEPGRYGGTLALEDDFDKKASAKKSFTIG
jgi:plastocyanin